MRSIAPSRSPAPLCSGCKFELAVKDGLCMFCLYKDDPIMSNKTNESSPQEALKDLILKMATQVRYDVNLYDTASDRTLEKMFELVVSYGNERYAQGVDVGEKYTFEGLTGQRL